MWFPLPFPLMAVLLNTGTIAAVVAYFKRQNPFVWFLIGFVFGWVGLFFSVIWPPVPVLRKSETPGAPLVT